MKTQHQSRRSSAVDRFMRHTWLSHPSRCHLVGFCLSIAMVSVTLFAFVMLSSSQESADPFTGRHRLMDESTPPTDSDLTKNLEAEAISSRRQLHSCVQSIHAWLPNQLDRVALRAEMESNAKNTGIEILDFRVIEPKQSAQPFRSVVIELETIGSRTANYRFVESMTSATQPLQCLRLRILGEETESTRAEMQMIGFFSKSFEWKNSEGLEQSAAEDDRISGSRRAQTGAATRS
ncbi:MAG: hypothetical protein AAF802_03260 [Planctomycetota bacterium]